MRKIKTECLTVRKKKKSVFMWLNVNWNCKSCWVLQHQTEFLCFWSLSWRLDLKIQTFGRIWDILFAECLTSSHIWTSWLNLTESDRAEVKTQLHLVSHQKTSFSLRTPILNKANYFLKVLMNFFMTSLFNLRAEVSLKQD